MTYSMDEASGVARQATADLTKWLQSLPETLQLQNVENDPNYQHIDVDLLLTNTNGTYQLEIKGDRWHTTGNFFFETHSNKEKNTPGCFIYTQANYLLYYFITPRTLYILPIPETRHWFTTNINRFPERSTTTPVRGGGHYTTVGRLVPIETVIQEVPGVKQYQL